MHYILSTILNLPSQAGYVTLPPATMDHNRALLKTTEEISILLSVTLKQLWSDKSDCVICETNCCDCLCVVSPQCCPTAPISPTGDMTDFLPSASSPQRATQTCLRQLSSQRSTKCLIHPDHDPKSSLLQVKSFANDSCQSSKVLVSIHLQVITTSWMASLLCARSCLSVGVCASLWVWMKD